MTWCDPTKPGKKPGCNPLTFFLLKWRRFDFFNKIGIDSGDPVTRSKPGDPEPEPWTGPGLKTMVLCVWGWKFDFKGQKSDTLIF
jgi:hypothetical protein